MNNGNYPYGWADTSNEFMMPEANQEDAERIYKSLPWQLRQNGTQDGINALKASLERNDAMDLYNEYATPEQSFETFCDDCANRLGSDWIYLLSRRTKDK